MAGVRMLNAAAITRGRQSGIVSLPAGKRQRKRPRFILFAFSLRRFPSFPRATPVPQHIPLARVSPGSLEHANVSYGFTGNPVSLRAVQPIAQKQSGGPKGAARMAFGWRQGMPLLWFFN